MNEFLLYLATPITDMSAFASSLCLSVCCNGEMTVSLTCGPGCRSVCSQLDACIVKLRCYEYLWLAGSGYTKFSDISHLIAHHYIHQPLYFFTSRYCLTIDKTKCFRPLKKHCLYFDIKKNHVHAISPYCQT